MKVSEIFYSLQGEGGRTGAPSIFIRLSGCSAKHACYQSGVLCDTEFEGSVEMSPQDIRGAIESYPGKTIVWTGGEPLDQLTQDVIDLFKDQYRQCIETSGVKPLVLSVDYVSLSPKVAEHVLVKNFKLRADGTHVDELRYVRHAGQALPEPALTAHRYFLSPHFDGMAINHDNARRCIDLCLQNPRWSLSLQTHKLLRIL